MAFTDAASSGKFSDSQESDSFNDDLITRLEIG